MSRQSMSRSRSSFRKSSPPLAKFDFDMILRQAMSFGQLSCGGFTISGGFNYNDKNGSSLEVDIGSAAVQYKCTRKLLT